jgi:hypothetical protein
MTRKPDDQSDGEEKASISLAGTVEKVIPPFMPGQPEKAEISVHAADELYREIRVDNTLQDSEGKEVSLKKGAEVEVKIEAEPQATKPKQ